jgi:hypothetical protein
LFFVTIVAVPCCLAAPQSASSTKAAPNIELFYRDLAEHYTPGTESQWDQRVHDVGEQILSSKAEECANALPAMFAALGRRDEYVQRIAALGLQLVTARANADGTDILGPHVREIGKLYDSSSALVQSVPNMLFYCMYPAPPEALQYMLTFLRRTDREQPAQVGATGVMLSIAPDNQQVADAVEEFMARTLNEETRVNTLDSIRYALNDSHSGGAIKVSDNYQIRKLVTSQLDRPEKKVKLAAIETIEALGEDALTESETRLRTMMQSNSEAIEVKNAANHALQHIAH